VLQGSRVVLLNLLGRIVGKSSTESGRDAVSHKRELGVIRPSGGEMRLADAGRLPRNIFRQVDRVRVGLITTSISGKVTSEVAGSCERLTAT
jgi:hypothetical protein